MVCQKAWVRKAGWNRGQLVTHATLIVDSQQEIERTQHGRNRWRAPISNGLPTFGVVSKDDPPAPAIRLGVGDGSVKE